jgi:N-acetylglucosaminyldiphosphoundecaprenol N-acetyl-beta-D-mannosaminyltransferase/alpha-1,3-mannosyltransferase
MSPPARRGQFLGLPLDPVGIDDIVLRLVRTAEAPGAEPLVATYLNAHTTNLAFADPQMARAIRASGLVYADGISVVKAARRRGIPIPGRATAADYFRRFCWAAAARHTPIALIGGPDGLASRCAANLQRDIPALRIALTHHGYIASGDEPALADTLRASGARIVLLGMGSPQQERLAHILAAHRAAPVLWCVGALFEYFAGHRARVPAWMAAAGFEWLFRLSQEPRRLARRYLLGNLQFLARTALDRPVPH